jgi:squalene-associated FAD-dependent desaturase
VRCVVVGGGFAGLAAATRLAGDGHAVTLLERRPQLGGRAYSVTDETTGDVIDNGQHLFMGCYRALDGFLLRIGARDKLRMQERIDVALLDGSQLLRLRAAPLPPPFDLLGGLAGFHALSVADRLRLGRVALAVRMPSARTAAASDWETVETWLDRVGQSEGARRRFWRPLTLATLNEAPERASAKMLEAVLQGAFLGPGADGRLGMARVGLSDLYTDDARRYLEARGGRVRLGAPVARIELERDGRVASGVALRDGELVPADAVVVAVPPRALLELLPPALVARESYFASLHRLEASPIVSVHLWLDRRVTDEEMVGLIDRPMHWIFNRNRLAAVRDPSRSHLSLVTSAARRLIDLEPEALVETAWQEVARALPAARAAARLHARVMKEREATIAHAAGSESHRPRVQSPVDGLFLAGDWVRTGLPATVESAVLSADAAADAVRAYRPAVDRPAPASERAFIPLSRLGAGTPRGSSPP